MQAADVEKGLQSLGLHDHTDASPLHVWSKSFPAGHFDGHQSVLPAPDHLLFHGRTKKLVSALFFMLQHGQRAAVEASMRDGLQASLLHRTRVYNLKTQKINGLTISEWAAVLTIAPAAFSRVLTQEVHLRLPAPVLVGLDLLEKLRDWAVALYFYPRVTLDGAAACRARSDEHLASLLEAFMEAVKRMCLRLDCGLLKRALDVPNLHRTEEVSRAASRRGGFLHVRHFAELGLEAAHLPNKRAIARGNGRDDAGHAMRKMVASDFFSRLALNSAAFGIPEDWMAHRGVARAMRSALPLWSRPSRSWTISGRALLVQPPPPVSAVAALYVPEGASVTWSLSASRGDGRRVCVGDAVCVLVSGTLGRSAVNASHRRQGLTERVAFFRVVGLFKGPNPLPCAIVQRFVQTDEVDVFSLMEVPLFFLKMQTVVRRALALHKCESGCYAGADSAGMHHSEGGKWFVIGRSRGYPSRSA